VLFGAYAIVVGIAQLWLGLRLRSLGEQLPIPTETLGTATP
jgi:hypothetical protein